jgi:hypothetical protein
MNYHTGVMLLEKLILSSRQSQSQPITKRARAPAPAPIAHTDTDEVHLVFFSLSIVSFLVLFIAVTADALQAWTQLSRLYEALGEEDILLGLYDKHIARHPYTKVYPLLSSLSF